MFDSMQQNSQFAMKTAVSTSESIARIMMESIPSSIELTVKGIFAQYRLDATESAKQTAELYGQIGENAEGEGKMGEDQKWWYTEDKDAEDPFDQFSNPDEIIEKYAPTPQREAIRSQNAK
jgi:hypothetical protein